MIVDAEYYLGYYIFWIPIKKVKVAICIIFFNFKIIIFFNKKKKF